MYKKKIPFAKHEGIWTIRHSYVDSQLQLWIQAEWLA